MSETLIENSVDLNGLRMLHVMGNALVSDKWLEYVPDVSMARVNRQEDEIHLHHLWVTWQAREVVRWTFEAKPLLMHRNVVLWFIAAGERASKAIQDAAFRYAINLGVDPLFAFMRQMPSGAQEGVEVNGVMLIRADWVPLNFVVLDGAGTEKLPEYRLAGGGQETCPQQRKQMKLMV